MSTAGWITLGLIVWFVGSFPLGVAVGERLRSRQPAELEDDPEDIT